MSYYNLPINKDNFFKLIELSSKRDMSKYQNSFISSSYLSFGVHELTKQLDPDYIFLILEILKNVLNHYLKKDGIFFMRIKKN